MCLFMALFSRCVLILSVPSPKKLDNTYIKIHVYTFASSKHREHSCAVRLSCRVGPDCVFGFVWTGDYRVAYMLFGFVAAFVHLTNGLRRCS